MRRTSRVLIYLADLSHTGLQVATESFPLNIGLIASYALKRLGNDVEIRLFKYPEKLTRAIDHSTPDILGCSNYVWNSNLSEWALAYAKRRNSGVVTVQGGTNYPFSVHGQQGFLRQRPNTDFCVFYEGEVSFFNLVKRFIEVGNLQTMKEEPIGGCHHLSPANGSLVSGGAMERIKTLDEVLSPYVTGLLDEFFDGTLTPIIETTRGCPFSCNFCNTGDAYFNRVNMFSLGYVKEELNYIAPRIARLGISHLTLADSNFGMYPRDADVSQLVRETQERYGWPSGVIATTGKNRKERIIKATEILGESLLVSMSVQSMNRQVLTNIKRDNIKLDVYEQINHELVKHGRSGMAELIFPLPGETYLSFLDGVEACIKAGATKITTYTLELLYGTDYKEPEYLRQHGYISKWRLLPLDFGEYEGEQIFDAEEFAIGSKSVSFDDYLLVRRFALLIESVYNDYLFSELLRYIEEYGVSPYQLLRAIWNRRTDFPSNIAELFDSFEKDTRGELFDTEEAMRDFYRLPENYARLVRGEIGGSVIYRHKARLISQHIDTWLVYVASVAKDIIASTKKDGEGARINTELAELVRYLGHKLNGMLNAAANVDPIVDQFDHEIGAWLRDSTGRRFRDFVIPGGVDYAFYFEARQLRERADSFKRYGTDPHGLAKILARVPSHKRLFRLSNTVENSFLGRSGMPVESVL